MNDKQRQSDFEQAAHDSWRWILEGEKLFQAAEYLHKEYVKALRLSRKKKSGIWHPGAEMLAPMIFMRASSLENLIKALYVKYGNSVTNGKGNLDFKKHKLQWFYTALKIKLTSIESETLEKLSDAIYSWGRYPVPMSYKFWRMNQAGIMGIQPIFIWSDNHERTYYELLQKTRSLLKKRKGQAPPIWYK